MVRVKICGITNLEDALAAIEAGADEIGFNFYARSPRFISAREARAIVEALPVEVSTVGVFVNETEADLLRTADEAGMRAVQLHGDETPAYCARLRGKLTIKALRASDEFDPASASSYETDAVLLDAYVPGEWGGTGRVCDWEAARRVRAIVPRLYLAGGLAPGNVAEAIDAVGPFAVDVCSGVELSPRRKDEQLMRDFVERARAASAGA